MICRECVHAVIGSSDSDRLMAKYGYRSCAAARNAIERGLYVKGSTECNWPLRFQEIKKK